MTDSRDRIADGIAIVGVGAVFPGAGDATSFWRNICAGVDAVTEVPPTRWDPDAYYDPEAHSGPVASDRFYCRRGGFIDELATFDPTRFGIMPAAVAGTEPDQLLALRAAAEAIADAGGDDRLPDRARIGVFIGRGGYIPPGQARLEQRIRTAHQLTSVLRELVPGIEDAQLSAVRKAFQDKLGPEAPDASIGLVPNFAASRIANRFDLRGPAYTVDAACASSLLAVEHAVRELTSGRCDAVLAGAVHHCHDVTLWSVFSQLRALSPSEQIRPFDRRADGTLVSEGTGVVLLKRLADAERAGDRIYAVIRGVGVASDGRASSLMSPLADGQVLALERAWQDAGLDPTAAGSLGLLEAHGTATPIGDRVEMTTLGRVFGPRSPDGPEIGLGTVKSMIGHAMPASGIAGLIKAALAVHHGVLPPTLHVEEPHPALTETRFAPVTETRPWERSADAPRRAAINAFGFGGINAHVILEEPPGVRGTASPLPSRDLGENARLGITPSGGIFTGEQQLQDHGSGVEAPEPVLLLCAATGAELARQLEADDADLIRRAGFGPAPDGGPCRLAIVAPDPRRLALARKIVSRGTPWRGRSDVWFTPLPLLTDADRLAFLFPGFEPDFQPRVDDVAKHFGLPMPRLHHSDQMEEHAVDVITVGRLLAAALRELDIAPSLMAGHSLGEWTAMIVAGMYRDDAIDTFIGSLRPGMVEVPDVVYAALGCAADQATEVLDELGLNGVHGAVVSHDNCPHQSVICGRTESVEAALVRLRERQVLAQPLPFRTGFHSPMLEPYLAQVHETSQRLPLQRPTVPVWSATSLEPFPDTPEEVWALVIRHLIEPVRFRQLLERLHDNGVKAFVQVGPGSLNGFVEDTLRDRDHLVVATNLPQHSGLAQLRRVAAALWTEGMSPRFDRLPGGAHCRPAQSGAVSDAASTSTTSVRATAGKAVRLDLGTPMIRLDGAVAPFAAREASIAGVQHDHPVLAELDALLQDAATTARTVVAAWGSGPTSDTRDRTVTSTQEKAAAGTRHNGVGTNGTAPSPGHGGNGAATRTSAATGPAKATTTHVFSLETMPDIVDHSLLPLPDGWPDPSDGWPVVPLTVMLEVMADAARDLVPGHTVVGFSQIKAMRWLIVAPPTTTKVHAVALGDDQVKVTIEGYASGTVQLSASGFPAAPAPQREPLTGEQSPEVDGHQMYADRWMFHGPLFAGIAKVDAVADDGLRGVLETPQARGGLLDSAGQLIGHWMQVRVPIDKTVFPVGPDSIQLYGPPPRPGERLAITVWIRSVSDTQMRADAELCDADGRVWARIDGWTTHRFATDDLVWALKFHPEKTGVSETQPDGWWLVRERWPNSASRELMMRSYLNATERAAYEQLNPRAQRQWLLGRIAAKDAVRHWLWDRGAEPIYPVEITVRNDEQGRPYLDGARTEGLQVSLAHTAGQGRDAGLAVGVAGPGPVGIDIEAVAERNDRTEEIALTRDERALLDQLGRCTGERAVWFTRFWTAKEAVAKAMGTGLQGRPKRFAVAATGEGTGNDSTLLVTVAGEDGKTFRVQTRLLSHRDTPYVAAWTVPETTEPNTTRRHADARGESDDGRQYEGRSS